MNDPDKAGQNGFLLTLLFILVLWIAVPRGKETLKASLQEVEETMRRERELQRDLEARLPSVEARNQRRIDLILQRAASGLSAEESKELAMLQRMHEAYLDTVAPLPFQELEAEEAYTRRKKQEAAAAVADRKAA